MNFWIYYQKIIDAIDEYYTKQMTDDEIDAYNFILFLYFSNEFLVFYKILKID